MQMGEKVSLSNEHIVDRRFINWQTQKEPLRRKELLPSRSHLERSCRRTKLQQSKSFLHSWIKLNAVNGNKWWQRHRTEKRLRELARIRLPFPAELALFTARYGGANCKLINSNIIVLLIPYMIMFYDYDTHYPLSNDERACTRHDDTDTRHLSVCSSLTCESQGGDYGVKSALAAFP